MRTGIVSHAEALRVGRGQAIRVRLLVLRRLVLVLHVGVLLRGHDRGVGVVVGHAPAAAALCDAREGAAVREWVGLCECACDHVGA